jgi:hypothetical protein
MSDSAKDFLTIWVVQVVLLPVAVLFMLAWNYVAPTFAIPSLDYWHAFALLFVLRQIMPRTPSASGRAVKRLRAVRLPAFDRDEALAIAGLAILAAGVALSHGIPAALIVVGVGLLAYAVLYSLLARPTEPTP